MPGQLWHEGGPNFTELTCMINLILVKWHRMILFIRKDNHIELVSCWSVLGDIEGDGEC